MAWSGIKVEGETLNDGGRKLKLGTFPYKVTGASMAVVKADVTGKTQQVVVDLLHGESYACRIYFSVMAENVQQREIAEKGLRALAQACDMKAGVVKPETLKKLVDSNVLISAVETPNKKGGAPYINISTIEPYSEEEEEEEVEDEDEDEAPAPAVKAKKSKPAPEPEPEEDEDEEDEDEEEEEEAPKPAAGGKKRPW